MKTRFIKFIALLLLLIVSSKTYAQMGIGEIALSGKLVKEIISDFQRSAEQLIFQGERTGNTLISQLGNQVRIATLNASYVMDSQREKMFNDLTNNEKMVFTEVNTFLENVNEATDRAATIAEIANINLIEFTNRLPLTEKTDFYVSSIKGLTHVYQKGNYILDIRGLGLGIPTGDRKYFITAKVGNNPIATSNIQPQNATDLRIIIPNKDLSAYFKENKIVYIPFILNTIIKKKESYWFFFEEEVEKIYSLDIKLILLPKYAGKLEGYQVLQGEALDGTTKTTSKYSTTPGACSNKNPCRISETIDLALDQRAMRVYYTCDNGMCQWSYPQRPGKGYDADFDILDGGTKVQVYRVTEGGVGFTHWVDYQTVKNVYSKIDVTPIDLAFNESKIIELDPSNQQGAYNFKVTLVTGQESFIDHSMSTSADNLITRVGYSREGDHYKVILRLNQP